MKSTHIGLVFLVLAGTLFGGATGFLGFLLPCTKAENAKYEPDDVCFVVKQTLKGGGFNAYYCAFGSLCAIKRFVNFYHSCGVSEDNVFDRKCCRSNAAADYDDFYGKKFRYYKDFPVFKPTKTDS